MITIKRAEIRTTHNPDQEPEQVIPIDSTVKNAEFNSKIKQLHQLIAKAHPGKAINYIVFSEEAQGGDDENKT